MSSSSGISITVELRFIAGGVLVWWSTIKKNKNFYGSAAIGNTCRVCVYASTYVQSVYRKNRCTGGILLFITNAYKKTKLHYRPTYCFGTFPTVIESFVE
jgi:hypothetical protein